MWCWMMVWACGGTEPAGVVGTAPDAVMANDAATDGPPADAFAAAMETLSLQRDEEDFAIGLQILGTDLPRACGLLGEAARAQRDHADRTLRALVVLRCPETVPWLGAVWEHAAVESRRFEAAAALLRFGGEDAERLLHQGLDTRSPEARAAALAALGGRGKPEDCAALLPWTLPAVASEDRRGAIRAALHGQCVDAAQQDAWRRDADAEVAALVTQWTSVEEGDTHLQGERVP